MKPKSFTPQDKHPSPRTCRVCGDFARGRNFGVMTCMSCKMFFRRHAESQLLKKKCQFNETCKLSQKTRRSCVSCRLKQCFTVGMDPQLIRHSFQPTKKDSLPKLTTLDLLQNDRSKLALDEWNLLTNIVNTYNEQNLFLRTTDFLQNQFSLPPKIRSKGSHTLNHIESLFSTIYSFINRCPLFYSLSLDIRKHLIKRNLNVVGSFNGFFMGKEMNIFDNEIYSNYIDNIYGNNYSNSIIQASQRLEQNGTLIQILLMILIFSTNCAIVTRNPLETIQMIFDTKLVTHIQNIFVTLLWKYLNYQYGFNEAVLRVSSLVKSILDLIQRMEAGLKIQKHWIMVNNVVEQATRSLDVGDISIRD